MLISIVTPSYNLARFLPLTIDSVLSQAGDFELEYLVIDGGSTDGTLEILRKYEGDLNSGRIKPACAGLAFRWLSEKDRGQSDAINQGLRIAGGEVAAYLNADDLLAPGCLQAVSDFFEKHPDQKFLTGYCRVINEQGREIRKAVTRYKKILLRFPSFNNLLKENFISQPATFWRRDVHREVGYFDEKLHYVMDYDLWCRLASKYRINVIREHLADFRWYRQSKSGGGFGAQFDEEYRIALRYLDKRPMLRLIHRFNTIKTTAVYRLWSLIGGG
ncbi:MAG: glycosyltransferase family 2 protein [Candidatus Edwardsbacteria bacterium]|nr:glycosyltransferase family 2 protein [Candidatus Edwardsbacteria bacterium]